MRLLFLAFILLYEMPSLAQSLNPVVLKEVVIDTNKIRNNDKASEYSAKLPLRYLENPQVVQTVSAALITRQGLTDLSSIITRNLTGVSKGWSATAPYYNSRGFNTRNYIRNGVAGYVTADVDIANLEQLSVIKGPSGTLFGSSLVSFGGVLNRITKKPLDSAMADISFQTGSYNLNRLAVDINTPLNKVHTALMRVNASYHYEGSFQDAGFLRSTFVAPSLIYKASERLTFSLDAEIYLRESTSQPQFLPTGQGAGKVATVPGLLAYDKAYSNNSITLKNPNTSFYGQINYKLSDSWNSQTNLVSTMAGNTGNYLTFSLPKGDSLLVRNITQYPTGSYEVRQLQQNFTGNFRIGQLRNRLVAGLEFYQSTSSFSSNALNGRAGRPAFDTLNLRGNMAGYNQLSPAAIDRQLGKYVPVYSVSCSITYALYVSDVIDITDRLHAMLSWRVDRFNNKGTTNTTTGVTTGEYGQTSFSPKLGLVYEIVKNRISVFVNNTNGFQNVAPVTQPDGTISTFKPQYANQFEGGLKLALAGELLSSTISYYNIKVKNTVRSDPKDPAYSIQEGSQYSRGMEIDLQSTPFRGLMMNAGFAFNKSELTSGDPTQQGLRPVSAGPETTVNWFISYQAPRSLVKGLGVGLGGNYASRNLIINTTTNGQYYLNGYTLINISLFYQHARYRFSLTADNAGNMSYYTGGSGVFTPGMPRRITAGMAVRF